MKEARTYTPEFDQEAYARLWALPVTERIIEREKLDKLTGKNLETMLAERFNVLVSKYNYDMIDGQLWGEGMNEPAIDSFRRGVVWRRKHGNPADWPREDAEIVGFEKIEQMLREEKDVLLISPPGESYKHNFYDIFKWKNGRIEARRYSSGLEIEDYQKLLGIEHSTAEEFLENPIDISSAFDSPDKVHKYLHRDHETTSLEVYENYILPGTREAMYEVLQAYYDGDVERQQFWLNAYVNAADEINDWVKELIDQEFSVPDVPIEFSVLDYARLANQEVREVSTGCGLSGGFKLGGDKGPASPWSVSEFGKKGETCGTCNQSTEDDHYHCPGCGSSYESERSKPASSRTKVCAREVTGDSGGICGFKFAC